MKTKFYLMTMIALAMIACGERNTPSTPNGNGNGGGNSGGGGNGGGSTTKVEINFSYRVVKPFTVEFTNTSVGADSYKWDFGDGDYSSNKDVTHAYASTGTYTVTLTGTANGTKYDCRKKITIKNQQYTLQDMLCIVFLMKINITKSFVKMMIGFLQIGGSLLLIHLC